MAFSALVSFLPTGRGALFPGGVLLLAGQRPRPAGVAGDVLAAAAAAAAVAVAAGEADELEQPAAAAIKPAAATATASLRLIGFLPLSDLVM
jgi:hypothetical protein